MITLKLQNSIQLNFCSLYLIFIQHINMFFLFPVIYPNDSVILITSFILSIIK